MVRINYIERIRECLDSFIHKEFIELLEKVEQALQRKLTDKESAILKKGFETGLLIGVEKIMVTILKNKEILLSMIKEEEQTKVSTK